MNPQNLGRAGKYGSVAGRVGSQALEQLKLFGRALEDAGIFRGSSANRAPRVVEDATTQLRIPYTQSGRGAQAYSPSKSLTNPLSPETAGSAFSIRSVDTPRVPYRGESPGQMSIFAAPEPAFPAPLPSWLGLNRATEAPGQLPLGFKVPDNVSQIYSAFGDRRTMDAVRNSMKPRAVDVPGVPYRGESPGQMSIFAAPEPAFPAPIRVMPSRTETYSDLYKRDPGTAKSVLNTADSASEYYGIPREEVLRGLMSKRGTAYLRDLENANPGGVAKAPQGDIPNAKSILSVSDEIAAPSVGDMRNAVGGVKTRNLVAGLALLGGGGLALQALRESQGGESGRSSLLLGDGGVMRNAGAPGELTAQAPDPLVPPPSNAPMGYRDPSAGPVTLSSNDSRDSAVREQIQQYAKGPSGVSKYEKEALLNQAAQREAGMTLMPEILKGLGYTTKETAGLAQWAVAHPELALAEYNRQIQRGAVASNLNVRSEFPSPGELAPPDPINQAPAGVIQGSMVNTSMGSNFVKNAVANSHFVPEAYMTGSQGASELADATQPLSQPTLLTDQQYVDQQDSRLEDTVNIQNEMLRRAMELKMGSSGY